MNRKKTQIYKSFPWSSNTPLRHYKLASCMLFRLLVISWEWIESGKEKETRRVSFGLSFISKFFCTYIVKHKTRPDRPIGSQLLNVGSGKLIQPLFLSWQASKVRGKMMMPAEVYLLGNPTLHLIVSVTSTGSYLYRSKKKHMADRFRPFCTGKESRGQNVLSPFFHSVISAYKYTQQALSA